MSKLIMGALTGAIVTATVAPTLNVQVDQGIIHAFKFQTPRDIEVLKLFGVVYQGVTGGIFRIGIYQDIVLDNANPLCPGPLMLQTDDLAADTSGSKEQDWSLLPPTLQAGEYWLACWAKQENIKFKGQATAAMPVLAGGDGNAHGINHFLIPYPEDGDGVNLPMNLASAFLNYTAGASSVVHMGVYKYYL
jgi:hypothetical protein